MNILPPHAFATALLMPLALASFGCDSPSGPDGDFGDRGDPGPGDDDLIGQVRARMAAHHRLPVLVAVRADG